MLPPEKRTEFTPEEAAEFDALMAKIDRQVVELHASADRTLILMGLQP